jgi:hypothetical protein
MGRSNGLGCNEVLFPHHNIALGTLTDYSAGNLYRPDGRFRLLSVHRHYTGIHIINILYVNKTSLNCLFDHKC